MTTSTTHPTMQELTPASTNGRRRRAGRFITGILCTAAVFTFGIHNVGGGPAALQADNYGPGSTYAPGGSMYNEQVPLAARQADLYGPGSTFAPGGSMYNEQVPAAAR